MSPLPPTPDLTAVPSIIVSVGHSNRSLGEFIVLLRSAAIALVVDVRSVPRSRANPQFNRDTLPASLASAGIAYAQIGALGGLRPHSKTVPPSVNALWTNSSFHNYADYALSPEFHAGFEQLLSLARNLARDRADAPRTAIVCSEAVWWRCHRRIIADHLLARGLPVFHLLALRRLSPATLTLGAHVQPDHTVVYPAPGAYSPTP